MGFNKENFQVKDIGAKVQEAWPEGLVTYLPKSVLDPRDYKVNFNLLESIFPDFQPSSPLNSGVMELKNLLTTIGYSQSDRNSKRFIRLNELQARIGELLY